MVQSIAARDLGNGVSQESLLDGQIVAFTITAVTRAAVDTWLDALLAEIANWPSDRPICFLCDQSTVKDVTATPYMKSRFSELARMGHGKSGRAAVVVGKGFFVHLANLIVRHRATI